MNPLFEQECKPYENAWGDVFQRVFGPDWVPPFPDDRFYEEAAAGEPVSIKSLLTLPVRRECNPARVMVLALSGRLFSYSPDLVRECRDNIHTIVDMLGENPVLLTRLLLRAAETAQVEERPHLVESVWTLLESLFASPRGEVKPFGDKTGDKSWRLKSLKSRVDAAAASRRRGNFYRIRFPTANAERGQLVWAEITICPALDEDSSSGGRLILAPWTFFLPGDERDSSGRSSTWDDLCKTFRKVMEGERTAPQDYLLSLQAFGPEDMPTGEYLKRLAGATVLTPPCLTIGGASLGVAVALAARAAAAERRVRPVVATGMILDDKRVAEVGLVPSKLRAWNSSWTNPTDAPLFLYPLHNQKEVTETAEKLGLSDKEKRLLISLQTLNELEPGSAKGRDFFTDGFDGYRSRLPELIGEQDEPSPRIGKTAEMFQAIPSVVEALSPDVWEARQHDNLIAWFDEEPKDLADDIFRPLAAAWDKYLNKDLGKAYNSPVVICVSVDHLLAGKGWPNDSVLSRRLALAVQARWGTAELGGARPLPTAEDFAYALRREGKLILIVYDRKSLEFWNSIDDDRCRLMNCLKKLATPSEKNVKPQRVVFVFSDLHHQKWFENGCPSAATVAASG